MFRRAITVCFSSLVVLCKNAVHQISNDSLYWCDVAENIMIKVSGGCKAEDLVIFTIAFLQTEG